MPELRVVFAPAAAGAYRAQLTDAAGQAIGIEVTLTPFMDEGDYEDLRWYLEDFMDLPDGGAVTRALHVERSLERWGRELYGALFTADENRALLNQLLAAPEPRQLTIATRDVALLRLPWELMADDAGSLAHRVSVRRQLERPDTTERRAAVLPLRILYIVSRPADAGFIDPRLSSKALFDALDPLGPNVRVDFCRPPTAARMEEMLRDGQRAGEPYDVVHFDGHGTFLPNAQIGALAFEKPDDGTGDSETDLVPAGRLGDVLAGHAIPLVVLEACRSGTMGRTAVFRSVAPRLIQAGVGSVLSMGHAVHDQLPAAEQRRRAIELFQQHHMLMVWDNFESALPQFNDGTTVEGSPYTDDERRRLAELFHDLTTGPGHGCLLVTCRPEETSLPGAQRYVLHGLARADSPWLLSNILKRDGLNLDDPRLSRDKLDPLLRDLQDHPLSLELVGPHLRTLTPEAIRAHFGQLLEKFQQEAPESRNQSLLASLEFSRRHLSPAAREALPWLALFSGGVFEVNLLNLSQLTPEAWEPIRRELEDIALVRVEDDILIAGRPFLRFHPTLGFAAADRTLAEEPETRARYVLTYVVLRQALDTALRRSQSHAALEILDREEANYRGAVRWAVADRQLRSAAALGDTFRIYLHMSSRLRERDAWVQWLRPAVGEQGFTEEAAIYEREHAYTRLTQGDPQGAVEQLQALVERLRHTTEFSPAFELANAVSDLGRVLTMCGASTQAVPILREAIGLWGTLAQKAGGQAWEALLATSDSPKAATELSNLSVTMGDLANALESSGHHDEALAVAERALEIDKRLGRRREVAAGHGRCASILMSAGPYDEADARYDLALATARQVGDKGLEGTTLQHQGNLALNRNQLDRATHLYQQTLQRFQEAGDPGGIIVTYIVLGVAAQKADRLAEARAWYQKSRELAAHSKDQPSLGAAAHNIGTAWQLEGDAARGRGDDEAAARQHFEEARRSVEEGLGIWQTLQDRPHQAGSLSQLAQINLRLGDLAAAERQAHEALHIRESLGFTEASQDYDTLSEIAQARGDGAAATEWARKSDAQREEARRRAGDDGIPVQMLKALQALTRACAQAGFGDGNLGPTEEEAVAQLEQFPAPIPGFAAFLRQVAAGQLPPIPGGLPPELEQLLEGVTQAIRQAQRG